MNDQLEYQSSARGNVPDSELRTSVGRGHWVSFQPHCSKVGDVGSYLSIEEGTEAVGGLCRRSRQSGRGLARQAYCPVKQQLLPGGTAVATQQCGGVARPT